MRRTANHTSLTAMVAVRLKGIGWKAFLLAMVLSPALPWPLISALHNFKVAAVVVAFIQPPATAQQLSKPGSIFSDKQSFKPLPANEAFPFFISLGEKNQLTVTWDIAPEHYLYRHKFAFTILNKPGNGAAEIAAVVTPEATLPDGVKKHDQFFGDIEAYYGNTSILLIFPSTPPEGSVLRIAYQGCADWGFCYPPETVEHPL